MLVQILGEKTTQVLKQMRLVLESKDKFSDLSLWC